MTVVREPAIFQPQLLPWLIPVNNPNCIPKYGMKNGRSVRIGVKLAVFVSDLPEGVANA